MVILGFFSRSAFRLFTTRAPRRGGRGEVPSGEFCRCSVSLRASVPARWVPPRTRPLLAQGDAITEARLMAEFYRWKIFFQELRGEQGARSQPTDRCARNNPARLRHRDPCWIQVAPGSCGCPIPRGVQGQAGRALEQPGLVATRSSRRCPCPRQGVE